MTNLARAGTFRLGDRTIHRVGYGTMQLTGPGVMGPPKDPDAAIALLREAVAHGVDHIDTSDAYGPHVANELLRRALHPYPEGLVLVTKVGAERGPAGTWDAAMSPAAIRSQVHENLRTLGVDALDVVNLRAMFDTMGPAEGSLEEPLGALVELQREGKVRHIGLSNVTPKQVDEGRAMAPIVCVQNHYNLAHRSDDALIDVLAAARVAFVPFFPLGGFSPLQSSALSGVAKDLGATPMQVALAWLLRRAPNVLLIPGTGSLAHLRENLAAANLDLSADALKALGGI
jgi:aryl-alcohol dehydrogenase-like predicted oxidoreductase